MLDRLDALAEARAAQERALRIFERVLPAKHGYIVQTLSNLAVTVERLGDHERAAELRAEAERRRGTG